MKFKEGVWYALCKDCRRSAVKKNKGGWCHLSDPMDCDICGSKATEEYYPEIKERSSGKLSR